MLLIKPAVEALLEKGREEGIQEGRQEGASARDAEWEAWYARLREAIAKGEDFDEPSPSEREQSR